MKKIIVKNGMMPSVFILLSFFFAGPAMACNTNTGANIYPFNYQGKYGFHAYKKSNGQLYKNNMRIDWDFGDGNSGSGTQIYHTYTSQGRFNVILYLWDTAANCGDTVYSSICYFRPQLTPTITRSNDTLYASVSCNSNWTYQWIFDDSTYGSGCSVVHKYAKPGFYKPVLARIEDTVLGCWDSLKYDFKVIDFTRCGFLPDFKVYSGSGNINERFFSSSPLGKYYRPAKVGSIAWKWGDNTTTNVQSIPYGEYLNHVYPGAGTYNLCHVITDSAGTCKDSSCMSLVVDSCQAQADFTYTISNNYVYFKAKATTGSFLWNFGGGSGSNATSSQPVAVYGLPGTYTVCLETTVSNCKKKVCKSITIIDCRLLGTYNYSIDTGDCLKAHFTQNTSKPNLIYKWDFGDTTSSTAKTPTHTYSRKGWFMVKLWARDTTSICKDSTYLGVHLLCNDCKIKDSLVLDYDTATPYQANLYNYSTGPIHKHHWDFGDGNSSTSASPTHTYTMTGRICIIYTATDTIKNCTDTTRFCFFIDSAGNIKRQVFVLNIITPGAHTGIKQQSVDAQNIKVYPNPFNSEFEIKGIENIESAQVEIFDALGRNVEFSSRMEGENCRIMIRQNTDAGLYVLRIRTDSGIAVYKLYKE